MTQQQEHKPKSNRGNLILWIAVGAFLSLFFFCLMMPGVSSGPVSRRTICKNNLKQLGLAFHYYHDDYGCFPPAYIADENGRPMHSWRVLILPYLDQTPLYKEYRFDEPWDGPNNSKLLNLELFFQCPAEEHEDKTMTNYVVIVGPKTVFPGSESVCIEDITDGSKNTIMVVEVEHSGIHWMEPRDLHVTQMARTINPKSGQGISSPHAGGVHVLFCDGAVRFLFDKTSPEMLRRLLEINDGEPLGDY